MACSILNVVVGVTDLINANGNLIYFDNALYVDFYDCDGNPQQQVFFVDGTFATELCYDTLSPVTLTIYQNDMAYAIIDSSYYEGDPCAGTPSPTPTTTQLLS